MPLRRLLLLTFVLGCIGVAAELLLLEHFEDWRQVVPLVLLVGAPAIAGWDARRASPASDRALRCLLAVMALSGVVGQVFHVQGNLEFERESDPAIGGWKLFAASMMGATPALAPGTMVLLAVVGYAYRLASRARS